MEIAIPAVALGALYIISNQKKKNEPFSTNQRHLSRKSSEYPNDTRYDLHISKNAYVNPNQKSDNYRNAGYYTCETECALLGGSILANNVWTINFGGGFDIVNNHTTSFKHIHINGGSHVKNFYRNFK